MYHFTVKVYDRGKTVMITKLFTIHFHFGKVYDETFILLWQRVVCAWMKVSQTDESKNQDSLFLHEFQMLKHNSSFICLLFWSLIQCL